MTTSPGFSYTSHSFLYRVYKDIHLFIIIIPVCLDAAGPVEFHSAESETVTNEVRDSQIINRERETTDVWN